MSLKDEAFYKSQIQDIVNGLKSEDRTTANKAWGKISTSKELLNNHDIMEAALTSPHPIIQNSYVGNQLVDPEILNMAADHPDGDTRAYVAGNRNLSHQAQEYLAKKNDYLVDNQLSQNENLSPKLKKDFLTHEDGYLRANMAKRKDLDPEDYEKLLDDVYDPVKINAATNLPDNKLAEHWHKLPVESKTDIANKDHLSPELRQKALNDANWEVPYHLASRKDNSPEDVEKLLQHPTGVVGDKVWEKNADKIPDWYIDPVLDDATDPKNYEAAVKLEHLTRQRNDQKIIEAGLKHGTPRAFDNSIDKVKDPETLKLGLQNKSGYRRNKVFDSEHVTPEIVKMGLLDPEDSVKHRALMHPKIDDEDLKEYLTHEDVDLSGTAAVNSKIETSPSLQEYLVNNSPDNVVKKFLNNSSKADLGTQTLQAAINHDNEDVRHAAVNKMDPERHEHLLEQGLNDDVDYIREAVAKKRGLTEYNIDKALEHSDPNVVDTVSTHQLLNEKQALKAKQIAKSPDAQKNIRDRLSSYGHWENENKIDVPFDSGRARIVRDAAMAKGGKIHKRDVEKMGIAPDTVGGKWDSQGNFNTHDLQHHIDTLPKHTYGTSDTQWHGGQRHSDKSSNVFQMTLTQDHADKLKNAGLFDLFKDIHEESHHNAHPQVKNFGIGWVRHTDDDKGTFIDEIQSDFGQALQRRMAKLKPESKKEAPTGLTEGEILANEQKQDDKQKNPEQYAKLKKIHNIVFADKHPSEVLHEGFLQHLRQNEPEKIGKGVHIWQPQSKATISLNTQEKAPPVHIQEGYGKIPKKIGYQPAAYGELEHQDATQHTGKPTQKLTLRKKETLYP